MELKASSPKPESVVPSDCASDPEETEVSDDDDDDRNHKHRKKEDRSQSLERDVSDPVINRPFRKRNKNFGNHHPFRENESMTFETMKTYSDATTDRDFYSKFERRRPGMSSVPRTPFDMSQRIRPNQSFAGDPGAGRGRGRESGFWNQRESRFNSMDVASQMVQQGPIHPALYPGRGLPNISNAQNASWNTFGLIPAVPNGGGLDILHPMGLQGTLRPPINSSLNVNIPRQRCRDFEERGFCLRGDMCPMEHGVNRIVIEDVQSLSQFNLPVSLTSAHLNGTPTGSGSLHSVNTSTASMNNKCKLGIISKSVVSDVGLPMDGAYPGPGCTSEADLYDPDQPLWNDRGPESSNALLNMQSSKIDDAELMSSDAPNSVCSVEATRTSVSLQGGSSSVWGRIGGSKNKFDTKEKSNPTMSSFHFPDNQSKEDNDELVGSHGASSQGKQTIADDAIPRTFEASLKAQIDMRNIRKPSQKAQRTLFVNGIPHKSNRREALLAHFKKFGEVIDIHIPMNTERAFVQFSKREEAEAALKAPDAVMGNRFIKLWWANRDCIPSDNTTATNGNGVIVTPRGQPPTSVPSHPIVTDRRKDVYQPDASRTISEGSSPSNPSKPVIADAPKVPPPLQRKLENLEHLKEELRKKQEILDQKRNEFKRQLNKLENKATGPKGEVTEPSAKKPKTSKTSDVAKLASPQSSDADIGMPSPHAETTVDKNKQLVNTVSQSPKASTPMRLQEPSGLKQSIQPSVHVNRYKLDNRPTAFRIIPPLPVGLANVAALKEHFLPYGELSAVELEDVQVDDSSQQEARLNFTTRGAAEQAFIKGKCWKEHNLKFMWVTPTNSGNATIRRERSLSAPPREPLDTTDGNSEENLGNSHEAIVSDNEHKDSETKNGSEFMKTEQDEDLQCPTSQESSAKQSPKDSVC